MWPPTPSTCLATVLAAGGEQAADFAHAVRQLEGHEVVAVAARSEGRQNVVDD